MLQKIMMGPFGAKFLADVKAADRQIFLWTVNEEKWMRWSIHREVDGVITDDPKKFKEVCDDWDDTMPEEPVTWRQYLMTLWIYVLVSIFGTLFRIKYREGVEEFSPRD
jgi:phosphatidylglycerol phospholipase C